MKKWIAIGLALFFSFGFANVRADDSQDNFDAQQFIQSWYEAEKQQDISKLNGFLAPQLLEIGRDQQIFDKNKQLEAYKIYNLSDFKLSDFKISRSGDVIIAIYNVDLKAKSANKSFTTGPTKRMIVLQKQNGKWLILALASYAKTEK